MDAAVIPSKEEIRGFVRGCMKSLSKDTVAKQSMVILEKLFHTEQYQQAESIYCYIEFQNEVMTKPLLRRAFDEGRRIAVPKLDRDGMEFYYIQDEGCLQKENRYGILEPADGCPLAKDEKALLIMPGMAFDKDNHRIGRGGGYYDRYLSKQNHHYKIALAYHFQIFDRVPFEEYDICPDLVLTDE
jgi:5-formyltetrahydrofolate cyclo-ligase